MNNTGLIDKYFVAKLEGEGAPIFKVISAFGDTALLWPKNSRSFVLSPDKDDAYGIASRAALLAYAESIETTNPKLATDLRTWARSF